MSSAPTLLLWKDQWGSRPDVLMHFNLNQILFFFFIIYNSFLSDENIKWSKTQQIISHSLNLQCVFIKSGYISTFLLLCVSRCIQLKLKQNIKYNLNFLMNIINMTQVWELKPRCQDPATVERWQTSQEHTADKSITNQYISEETLCELYWILLDFIVISTHTHTHTELSRI